MQMEIQYSIAVCYTDDARELYGEEGLYYATSGSAGADLRSAMEGDVTLGVYEQAYIPTGISLAMPECMMGAIYSRSGLGSRFGIMVTQGVGVIDADYRGEIIVALSNRGTKPYTIARGERIAQLVFHYVLHPQIQIATHLGQTQRGSGAFGSTGKA